MTHKQSMSPKSLTKMAVLTTLYSRVTTIFLDKIEYSYNYDILKISFRDFKWNGDNWV